MKKYTYQRLRGIIDTIKRSPNPLKFLWAIFLSKTGLCRFFIIRMRGYKLHFNPSSLSILSFLNRDFSIADENLFKQLLHPGDVYVDVGANIGTLALCASGLVKETGKVIAIEAHPKIFGYLSDNIAFNGFTNIELINYAVGKEEGTILFSNTNSDAQNKVMLSEADAIRLPVQKLDSLLQGEERITLLKIDVEGFEKFVLEGATEVLKRTELVYYECFDPFFEEYGYNTGDLIGLLELAGFGVYRIHQNCITALNTSARSISLENLLAIKDIGMFRQKTGVEVGA